MLHFLQSGKFRQCPGSSFPHEGRSPSWAPLKYNFYTKGFAILAALLLLSGSIILLYPSLNGLWVDYTMRRDAQEFLSYVEVKPFTPEEGIPSETISQERVEESASPTEHTQLWLDIPHSEK